MVDELDNQEFEIWIFQRSNLGQKVFKKNHQQLKHPVLDVSKKYDQKLNTLF